MDSLTSFASEMKDKLAAVRQQAETEGKKAVHDGLLSLFEKHPTLAEVSWAQYTPYFNDGEPCEFSVNDPYFKLTTDAEDGEEGWEGEDGYGTWNARYDPKWNGPDPHIYADIEAFASVIKSDEMEQALEMAFGDHSRIIATREGIEVEEYDHD